MVEIQQHGKNLLFHISGRKEPIMERMDRMMERLELLEQLVKKNSVPEGKIQS